MNTQRFAAFVLAGLLISGCGGEETTEPMDEVPAQGQPDLLIGTALSFRQMSAAGAWGDTYNSCGLTTLGKLYCWGNNISGQIGNGTTDNKKRPTAVAGGLVFRQVSAGIDHTCAIATDN